MLFANYQILQLSLQKLFINQTSKNINDGAFYSNNAGHLNGIQLAGTANASMVYKQK